MARIKHLDKRAREVILERMRDIGEMSTEEIMNLVRPHYFFDAQEAKEQGVRRQANQLVRSLRDDTGTRICFAVRKENLYVNLERCTDRKHIDAVEQLLDKQLNGLTASYRKAKRRKEELEGQLALAAQA